MSTQANQVSPDQLARLLAHAFKAQRPVLVTGAPGVGKSDIAAQAAAQAGARLIVSHPVVSDPTDYKGLPFPGEDGVAHFMPFGELNELINADSPTVYFLDDLGQAPPIVQAACMQLLLARRINGHAVSDQVTFLAATNRRQDRAGVTGILEPVKSRFACIVELTPDLDAWVRWALANGMPDELIAFIRFRPGLLLDFEPTADMVNSPCPRTVAHVGALMNDGLDKDLEFAAYSGAAGEGFATELLAFLAICRKLPNPDLVLMNPDQAEVPTDPATLYALCGALSRKASEQTAPRMVKYADRLPEEFGVLLIRDCIARDQEFVSTRAAIEWLTNHSDVIL